MRRLFVLILCMFVAHVYAQESSDSIIFRVNKSGVFKSIVGSVGFDHYIIYFDGKTAHDLYNDVLMRVSRKYVSPDNVTDKIEDRSIVVNSRIEEFIETQSKKYGNREWFDFFYRLEFNFKDGKIKVFAPSIVGGRIRTGARTLAHASYYPDNFVLMALIEDDAPKVSILEKYLNDILTYIVYGDHEEENW